MNELVIWFGIALCLTQSAMLSGLNLAVFNLNRLRLEAAAEDRNADARRVLDLRRDANRTLATILWGNVAVNVLLAQIADSVLAGVAAFLFATVVITLVGEIFPQAYFSRHALWVVSRLEPVLRIYEFLLWPVAWPSGKLLDAWIGPEGMTWFRERELGQVLHKHAQAPDTEIGPVEATGAVNFLTLDDIPVGMEGALLDPRSVIRLPFHDGRPQFEHVARDADDPFLRRVAASGKKWVVLVDQDEQPRLVASAPAVLRAALFDEAPFDALALCHRPLVVRDADRPLGQVLGQLTVQRERPAEDIMDMDLILVWTQDSRRIITGSDLLGHLLRGIARPAPETNDAA